MVSSAIRRARKPTQPTACGLRPPPRPGRRSAGTVYRGRHLGRATFLFTRPVPFESSGVGRRFRNSPESSPVPDSSFASPREALETEPRSCLGFVETGCVLLATRPADRRWSAEEPDVRADRSAIRGSRRPPCGAVEAIHVAVWLSAIRRTRAVACQRPCRTPSPDWLLRDLHDLYLWAGFRRGMDAGRTGRQGNARQELIESTPARRRQRPSSSGEYAAQGGWPQSGRG